MEMVFWKVLVEASNISVIFLNILWYILSLMKYGWEPESIWNWKELAQNIQTGCFNAIEAIGIYTYISLLTWILKYCIGH